MAFAHVIECAGTCITRRLQEETSTGCAQGSANRQARYQRSGAFAQRQGPDTRAPAFAEQRHKQRGLKHTAKTSCELHAGQRHKHRRPTSPHRRPTAVSTNGCCDVINAASSTQGRQHIAFAEARCTTNESTRSFFRSKAYTSRKRDICCYVTTRDFLYFRH